MFKNFHFQLFSCIGELIHDFKSSAYQWASSIWSFFTTEADALLVATALIGVLFGLLNLCNISRDSRDRTRPYVALEPRVGVQLNGSIDLVVTNYGQSAARDVSIKTTGSSEYDEKDYILKELKDFMGKTRYMAPNASFRIMWRSDYIDSQGNALIHGMPEKTKITVTYTGPKRKLPGTTKKYSEVITVDTGFTRAAPAPYEGSKTLYRGDTQVQVLKDIDLAIRTLNQHTGNDY